MKLKIPKKLFQKKDIVFVNHDEITVQLVLGLKSIKVQNNQIIWIDENDKEVIISNKDFMKMHLRLDKLDGTVYFEKSENSKPFVNACTVFIMFTTYGFPIEITEEIAKESGYDIDKEGFEILYQFHKENS